MTEPSRVRQLLGAELRAARTLAGLSQRDLHKRLPLSQPTISRYETGESLPDRSQAQAWLNESGASDEIRERVLALLEAAHNETRPYLQFLDRAVHIQDEVRKQETTARLIRNCQLAWIPGLLQTAEYARLLIPQVDPTGRINHAAAAAARMERQQVLYTEGRRFEFLIAEHVLSWSPGPDVMPGQLDRLASLATLASVEVAILPSRRIGAAEWHSFLFWEPAEGAPYVTTELVHGAQEVHDEAAVAAYAALWERLWVSAVVGDDAVAVIRRMM